MMRQGVLKRGFQRLGAPGTGWRKRLLVVFLYVLVPGVVPLLSAAVIGTNRPGLFVTPERIAALPQDRRPAWEAYLRRSRRRRGDDRAFLQRELKEQGLKEPFFPQADRSKKGLPLDKPRAWYGRTKARRIAGIIVSFQTPAGGWGKDVDVAGHRRAPGEFFRPDQRSPHKGRPGRDRSDPRSWNCSGSFDDGATIIHLRFLAKVIAAVGVGRDAPLYVSFSRGIDYILAAQYPNGGWPQEWPLTGKYTGTYHAAVNYNDNAMVNLLRFLRDVSEAKNEFAFVPAETRAVAAASLARGISCVLTSQIVHDGRRTVWGGQHDALTLLPAPGRKYEMPSQVSSESADIMMFLMELRDPGPEVVSAVHAAAAWFEKTALQDVVFEDGRLVPAPGKGPLWARFYEIGTDRPIFGDFDASIHDSLDEVSEERRRAYDWYRDTPRYALKRYAGWDKAHPR